MGFKPTRAMLSMCGQICRQHVSESGRVLCLFGNPCSLGDIEDIGKPAAVTAPPPAPQASVTPPRFSLLQLQQPARPATPLVSALKHPSSARVAFSRAGACPPLPAAAIPAPSAAPSSVKPPPTEAVLHTSTPAGAPQAQVAAQRTTPAQPKKKRGSFYRRTLPTSLVPFNSPAGRQMFSEALEQGGLEGSYWSLSENYTTQQEPGSCSLGTLAMVLNSLLIDPKRRWKGPWRWFTETELSCCKPMDVVKTKGMTFAEFVSTARCAGASVSQFLAGDANVSEATFRAAIVRVTSSANNVGAPDFPATSPNPQTTPLLASSRALLSSPVARVAPLSSHAHMIVSFNRQALGQTGTGHFSPIAGYHATTDMVLVMDVARFKYSPYWCPVSTLWRAMQEVDPESGKSRGYVLLSHPRYRLPAPHTFPVPHSASAALDDKHAPHLCWTDAVQHFITRALLVNRRAGGGVSLDAALRAIFKGGALHTAPYAREPSTAWSCGKVKVRGGNTDLTNLITRDVQGTQAYKYVTSVFATTGDGAGAACLKCGSSCNCNCVTAACGAGDHTVGAELATILLLALTSSPLAPIPLSHSFYADVCAVCPNDHSKLSMTTASEVSKVRDLMSTLAYAQSFDHLWE